MAYILDGVNLPRPTNLEETTSVQFAQVRTLDGTIARDYFGDSKRTWSLDYANKNPTDYATIKTIYDSYISSGNTKSWQVTEINYSISSTSCHVDLTRRRFSVGGTSYISDFTLVLSEA